MLSMTKFSQTSQQVSSAEEKILVLGREEITTNAILECQTDRSQGPTFPWKKPQFFWPQSSGTQQKKVKSFIGQLD